ncbi:hypothetical protein Ddc_00774 [Ditylenchus destructor]|nr:hypothetical protein Ddc_00774 [Ditylenchus destructor]
MNQIPQQMSLRQETKGGRPRLSDNPGPSPGSGLFGHNQRAVAKLTTTAPPLCCYSCWDLSKRGARWMGQPDS